MTDNDSQKAIDLGTLGDPNDSFDQLISQPSAKPAPTSSTPKVKQEEILSDRVISGLLERGIVTTDQIEIAKRELRLERSKGKSIDRVLIEFGFVTESTLGQVLSESSGIKNLDLASTILDANLINAIPHELAKKHKLVPISEHDGALTVAIADVYNIVAIDQLRKYCKHNKIIPTYAPESQIMEAIDQYYNYEMSIEGILKEIENYDKTVENQDSEHGQGQDNYVNPNIRIVDAFIIEGVKIGASDLHFEPEESFVRVRYRIDGKLIQIRSFHKDYWPAIVVRMKIISGMNITEARHAQDGRINFSAFGRDIDLRVATQPTIHGENIVMRILDRQQSLVSLQELGFAEENSAKLKRLLLRPEGIVVVTGPTGSGKTTTLYSILNFINTIDKNIMTLEDPVEYQMPLIRQTNINESAGVNFSDGIRSLLRQDPDVIFIGEVRDQDTASMAIRAAMTGHQVFTTLHTNDAVGAIPRFIDIGIDNYLLASSLVCIIAQRLTRCLCMNCREEYTPTEDDCNLLGISREQAPTLYHHKGCEKCMMTGYKGRVVISEILEIDSEVQEMIATNQTRNKMLQYATQNGFRTMQDDAISKVLSGITDIPAIISAVDMTERMKTNDH